MTFAEWIEAEKIDGPKLTELTGFHRSYVWKVLSGERDPSIEFIRRCIAKSKGKLNGNSFFPRAA